MVRVHVSSQVHFSSTCFKFTRCSHSITFMLAHPCTETQWAPRRQAQLGSLAQKFLGSLCACHGQMTFGIACWLQVIESWCWGWGRGGGDSGLPCQVASQSPGGGLRSFQLSIETRVQGLWGLIVVVVVIPDECSLLLWVTYRKLNLAQSPLQVPIWNSILEEVGLDVNTFVWENRLNHILKNDRQPGTYLWMVCLNIVAWQSFPNRMTLIQSVHYLCLFCFFPEVNSLNYGLAIDAECHHWLTHSLTVNSHAKFEASRWRIQRYWHWLQSRCDGRCHLA